MCIRLFIIIIILFLSSCSLNKVVKHHGVHFLEKKQKKIEIFSDNLNDVRSLLGPPSTKNHFDNDIWIYIERKTTVSQVRTLGKKKLLLNNVLILEINSNGQLIDKKFYDMNDMNEIKLSSMKTENKYGKKSFVYDFLSSMRQKINDPLGKRKKP